MSFKKIRSLVGRLFSEKQQMIIILWLSQVFWNLRKYFLGVQIDYPNEFIKNWDGKSNLLLVTHYVVILEMLNLGASSGEIIITNKNYETLGRIKLD